MKDRFIDPSLAKPLLVAYFVIASVGFCSTSAINLSINPLQWTTKSFFVYFGILFATLTVSILVFIDSFKKIDLEKYVLKYFDINEFRNNPRPAVNAITDNYSFVATLGLLFLVAVTVFQNFNDRSISISFMIFVLAFIILTLIYPLYFLRLKRRSNSVKWRNTLFGIALIDMLALHTILHGLDVLS